MNATVKITTPEPIIPVTSYPYWAKNFMGDLFLVTAHGLGIAVQYWDGVQNISPSALTPLPAGTKIELTIV